MNDDAMMSLTDADLDAIETEEKWARANHSAMLRSAGTAYAAMYQENAADHAGRAGLIAREASRRPALSGAA